MANLKWETDESGDLTATGYSGRDYLIHRTMPDSAPSASMWRGSECLALVGGFPGDILARAQCEKWESARDSR